VFVRETLHVWRTNQRNAKAVLALANRGHDTRALQAYLGHRNIQHTVRYTEMSPTRVKDFWRT
jgi:site-specific recombinase XerD